MRRPSLHNPAFLLAITWFGLLAGCPAAPGSPIASVVATIHQAGPVGYRDPIGVLSPDGRRLATVIPNQFVIHDLRAGTERSLPVGDGRIQHLVWRDDTTLVLGQPDSAVLWWSYDLNRGTRQPLWPEGHSARDQRRRLGGSRLTP